MAATAMQFRMAAHASPGSGRTDVRGWLSWWTIEQKERKESDLKAAGTAAQIPQWMIDKIKGRSPRSAWLHSTQLGAKGTPSVRHPHDPDGSTARYMTRDIDEETRALVREVTDKNGKTVAADTVARFTLGAGDVFQAHATPLGKPLLTEMTGLANTMRRAMADGVGMVDDARIRACILAWLERRYRVCVRGTGGVYFIPRPSNPTLAAEIEQELVAVRSFVLSDPVSSLFSIVAISPGGATTLADFAASAVTELRAELGDALDTLVSWQGNAKMNAGSTAHAASDLLKKVNHLGEKAEVLIDSLGEDVAVVSALLDRVRREAAMTARAAQAEVDRARMEKQATKAAQKSTGVSGTARDRARVQRIDEKQK